jgi:molecular chaperone GrpE
MVKNKDKKSKSDLDETPKSSQEEKELDTSLAEENEVLSELVKSLEEKILRSQAEIENVRKTSQKEILKARIYASESLAKELLSPIDNLQRALQHSDEDVPKSLLELVLKEINQAFSNSNVKEINPIGEKFNPNFHEALSVLEDQKKDPDEVLEVIQKGYLIEDRVIRPALVVVNKI